MGDNIQAAEVMQPYLQTFVPCALQAGNGLVLPAYNVEKAKQWLAQQDFLAVIIDLDCLLPHYG